MLEKQDLIDYCMNIIEFEEHYTDFDDNWEAKEQIKDKASEVWAMQDLLDFACESRSEYPDEILGDWYGRMHSFYEKSVTDEGKQVFANAMNLALSINEDLWNAYYDDDE